MSAEPDGERPENEPIREMVSDGDPEGLSVAVRRERDNVASCDSVKDVDCVTGIDTLCVRSSESVTLGDVVRLAEGRESDAVCSRDDVIVGPLKLLDGVAENDV